MNRLELEKLFVYIQANVDKKYEEECSMAIDCFLEEEFDYGQCTRFLEYLLTLIKEEKVDEAQTKMEKYLENNQ
ncbi:MAG: hypothetical protein ACI4U3_10375 [Traorella sp.]